jgi:hypothetical protein
VTRSSSGAFLGIQASPWQVDQVGQFRYISGEIPVQIIKLVRVFKEVQMKRVLFIATLFACVGLHAGQKKETPASLATAKNIFVGWVDISLDDWTALGYEDKRSWSDVIDRNNQAFQHTCQTKLASYQIKGAKDRSDEKVTGLDLFIKFSDVRFDVDSYRLYASVHFIDPTSGSELALIPVQTYRGGHFSVDNCMRGALETLADKLKDQMKNSSER